MLKVDSTWRTPFYTASSRSLLETVSSPQGRSLPRSPPAFIILQGQQRRYRWVLKEDSTQSTHSYTACSRSLSETASGPQQRPQSRSRLPHSPPRSMEEIVTDAKGGLHPEDSSQYGYLCTFTGYCVKSFGETPAKVLPPSPSSKVNK